MPTEPGTVGPKWAKSIGILSAVWLRLPHHAYFASNRRTKVGGCEKRVDDPRLRCQNGSQDRNEGAAARSKHPGGVVMGLADGSVSFIADDIALVVWQAVASRAGEEQF